jgi:ABC-type Na+ efflux pump permease subunit
VHLRKLLRIARWEVTKNAGGIDRRTVAVVLVAMAFLGVLAPIAASQGAALDQGLYRVGVSGDSPYEQVISNDETFVLRPDAGQAALEDGRVELLVSGTDISHARTPKGRAAYDEFRSAVRQYNDGKLRQEPNRTAAFPVSVTLLYEEQTGVGQSYRIDTGGSDGDAGTDGGTGGTDGGADGGTDGGTTDGGADGDTRGGGTVDGNQGGGGLGGLGAGLSGSGTTTGSPSDISPPFPFQSLVLAFVFIIPMNFLIQAYGSTFLSERLNRRGELMLVSPVTRVDIIAGKTLPYFAGGLAVEAVIAVGLTYLTQGSIGGLVSVLAVTPLVLLFLASTFLGAMFARSFKELTFVTVTITVGLTSYAFVPAIFTDVNPIALISPLTLVVRDLQNQAIAAPEFLFSVTPPTLSALVLFGLGTGLYREEDMFAQRAIPLKVLDALAGRISKRWHVLAMTALLLPFVFVLELVAIATLFALGELSIPLVLAVVAVVEELAKSLHVYAAYVHRRFERTLRMGLVLGALSGIGFFLGEKITLLSQLVGLPELEIGRAALNPVSGPLVIAFLLAPLVLHVVTATVSSLGASRGRRQYALGLAIAIGIHFAYNYTVVIALGP